MKHFLLKTWLTMVCLLFGVGTSWADKTYTKVTDASTLSANDVIILACDTKSTYAGAMGSNAYLTSVSSKSDAIEITLSGSSSGWTLTTSEGKIGATGEKKMSKTAGTTTWTIAINDGNATIKSTNNSYGSILYNASSPRFLNYTSSQTAIQIYKVTEGSGSTPTALTSPANLSSSNVTTTGAVLSWGAVTNASSYTVKIGETEYTGVNATSYNATGLTAGTQYTWTVKAVGDGTNYSTSAYAANATFTTEVEQGGSEPSGKTASFIFNTDAGLSALGISKPNNGAGTDLGSSNYTSGEISMTATDASTHTRVWNSNGVTSLRVYKDGGTLTFSGATITKIVFTGTVPMTVNVGTFSDKTWTGKASSVIFTATNSVTISTIEVTYESDSRATPELSFSPATYNYTIGEEFIAPTLTNPEEVLVTYSASNVTPANCIEVATDGTVTVNAAGSATITASFEGNDTYKSNSASYTLNVEAAKHVVTATLPEGGSYTVKVGDAEAVAVDADHNTFSVSEGVTVTMTTTADDTHKLHSTPFVVKDADDTDVKVNTSKATYSFTMPTKDVTITAQYSQTYSIVAGECEHGTVAVDAERNSKGSKVNVTVTPDSRYHTAKVYYVKEGETTENEIELKDDAYSFTMVASNITVYADFEEDTKHTITWSINGNTSRTSDFYENDDVVFPKDVADIAGRKFMGWIEADSYEHATDAPTYVTEATATADNTYYAVFATASVGAEGSVDFDVTTISDIQQSIAQRIQTTNGVTFTFSSVGTTGTNNGTVQMSKNSTLTQNAPFAGNIKSISFEGFAYSSTSNASMLVEGKKGTDGTYATVQSCNSTYNGTTIDFGSNEYDFMKITVGSDRTVKFTKMTVNYSGVEYSNYCTDIAYTRDNLTAESLGTICIPYAVSAEELENVAETVVFYEISHKVVEGETLKKVMFTPATELVAGMPYIFYAGDTSFTLHYNGVAATEASAKNGLHGAFEKYLFKDDDNYAEGNYYVINSSSKIQRASVNSGVNANRAYIVMSEVPCEPTVNSGRMLAIGANGFEFEEGTLTGIETIISNNNDEIYDLQGRRVVNVKNGLYIVNGKKVIR